MSTTRRTYSVRLTAEGGRQVVAELNEVGRTGEHALGRVERSSRDASSGVEDLSGRARGLSSAIATWNRVLGVISATTVATAGLQQAVLAYAAFEEGLIGVGKTADLSGMRLEKFGTRIETLSQRLPVPAEELLAIAQAAGQLGIKGEENILRFTETVARLGSASNLSGEAAATALARLLNVTGESAASVDILGSVIVALGNNFAATEVEIAHIANEVARASSVFGISSAEASAFAAAMAALGIQAELGGSSVGKALRAMDETLRSGGENLAAMERLTGQTGEQLKKIFATDAAAALQLFLQGLGRVIAAGGDATAVLDRFGLSGEEILKTLPVMAQRHEEVARALALANRETGNARALIEESEKAFQSFNAEMVLLKNTLSSVARAIGAELAPVLEILSRGLRRVFATDSEEERFQKLYGERLNLLQKIQRAEEHLGRMGSFMASGQSISSSLIPLRSRLTEVDAELRRLQGANIEAQRARTEVLAGATKTPPPSAGASGGPVADPATGIAAVRKDRLLAIEQSLQKELFDTTHQGAERILAEHQRLTAELEKLKTPDNAERVAVAERQAIAVRDARLGQLAVREAEVTRQRFEANQRIIEDLGLERDALQLTDRERFVSQAVRRLSAEATSGERLEVERLAGALFDERQALEHQRTAEEERQRLMERGRQLTESLRTAGERHADEVRELNELLRQGAIDQETYTRAMEQAHDRMLASSREWSAGVQRALKAYADEATNSGRNWEIATTNAFRGMEEALVAFISTGKADWKSLIDSILADLARITVRETITGPLAQALGMGDSPSRGGGSGFGDVIGSLGSLVSSIFHQGGIVGEAAPSRRVPAALFAEAPRMHQGGWIGSDEVPVIARRGERILNPQETRAYETEQTGSSMAERPIEIQIVNVTNPDQVKGLVENTIAERKDVIVNMVLNALDERDLVVRRI
ncbi:MAG: phage tail tape measure protein [Magnetococcales bacterium]|nr:phage tail tape measure protein [Magnetococcales bacterium]